MSNSSLKPKMLFGSKLSNEIYEPWKGYYLDYDYLKRLLKENVILQNSWNDKDEQEFVSHLDKNLEKVYSFQADKYEDLNNQLDDLQGVLQNPSSQFDLNNFMNSLDEILSLAQELDHFQRLNFTGFVKIVKKHDRLHPQYMVKPLLNVRLKNLPFHSEDYSPLLYKISALFQFLRENYNINESMSKLSSVHDETSDFQSFKFWIHPDNLMEVKTMILRHLPVLIFNSNGSGRGGDEEEEEDDYDEDEDEGETNDPIINSLYFDNPNFELYNSKLIKSNNSSTLRLKWLGNLKNHNKISLEKKCFDPNSEHFNIDEKLSIKPKNINSLLAHDLSFLKKKADPSVVELYKRFNEFIEEYNLQPVLRTIYKRTAFQIPGEDKIRITIDSNVNFIREDSFDNQRPIRDPKEWHRLDIDSNANFEKYLRTGEYSKFPYSIMEIKVKKFSNQKRKIIWIEDLINSHLVKEIPNFSKFIHGVSSLFIEDDHLENIPFWFNELEQDIKIDPREYFDDSKKIVKQNHEENLSKFKAMVNDSNHLDLRKSFSGSKVFKDFDPDDSRDSIDQTKLQNDAIEEQSNEGDNEIPKDLDFNPQISGTIQPNYDNANKLNVDSEDDEIELPPGVVKPENYLKNQGPLKIEPKVWLANERTFNRWLHVTTLLSSITFIIHSSAMKANDYQLSNYLAYIYFALTIFSGIWAYYIFDKRRRIIMERSEKHLDDMLGPLIIAVGLVFGLIFNFSFGFKKISQTPQMLEFYNEFPVHQKIHEFFVNII